MSGWFVRHPSEQALALFAGGELGPFSRWRIERHIETCAACKAEAADYFRLPEELYPLTELPNLDWRSFAESIEQRVRQERVRPTPAPERRWRPALALGATAAVLIAGFFAVTAPDAPEPARQTAIVSQPAAGDAPAGDDATVQADAAPPAARIETAPAAGSQRMSETRPDRELLPADAAAPGPPPVLAEAPRLDAASPPSLDAETGLGFSPRQARGGWIVAGPGGSPRLLILDPEDAADVAIVDVYGP